MSYTKLSFSFFFKFLFVIQSSIFPILCMDHDVSIQNNLKFNLTDVLEKNISLFEDVDCLKIDIHHGEFSLNHKCDEYLLKIKSSYSEMTNKLYFVEKSKNEIFLTSKSNLDYDKQNKGVVYLRIPQHYNTIDIRLRGMAKLSIVDRFFPNIKCHLSEKSCLIAENIKNLKITLEIEEEGEFFCENMETEFLDIYMVGGKLILKNSKIRKIKVNLYDLNITIPWDYIPIGYRLQNSSLNKISVNEQNNLQHEVSMEKKITIARGILKILQQQFFKKESLLSFIQEDSFQGRKDKCRDILDYFRDSVNTMSSFPNYVENWKLKDVIRAAKNKIASRNEKDEDFEFILQDLSRDVEFFISSIQINPSDFYKILKNKIIKKAVSKILINYQDDLKKFSENTHSEDINSIAIENLMMKTEEWLNLALEGIKIGSKPHEDYQHIVALNTSFGKKKAQCEKILEDVRNNIFKTDSIKAPTLKIDDISKLVSEILDSTKIKLKNIKSSFSDFKFDPFEIVMSGLRDKLKIILGELSSEFDPLERYNFISELNRIGENYEKNYSLPPSVKIQNSNFTLKELQNYDFTHMQDSVQNMYDSVTTNVTDLMNTDLRKIDITKIVNFQETRKKEIKKIIPIQKLYKIPCCEFWNADVKKMDVLLFGGNFCINTLFVHDAYFNITRGNTRLNDATFENSFKINVHKNGKIILHKVVGDYMEIGAFGYRSVIKKPNTYNSIIQCAFINQLKIYAEKDQSVTFEGAVGKATLSASDEATINLEKAKAVSIDAKYYDNLSIIEVGECIDIRHKSI